MMPTFNDRLEFFEPLEPRRGVSGSSLDFWVVVFVVLIGLLVVPICLLGDGRFLSAPTYPLQRSVSQRQPLTRDNELSEMSRGLHVLVTVSGDWTGPIKTDLLKHSRTIPVLDLQRNHWLLQDIQYQYWFIASYNDLISGTMSFLYVCGSIGVLNGIFWNKPKHMTFPLLWWLTITQFTGPRGNCWVAFCYSTFQFLKIPKIIHLWFHSHLDFCQVYMRQTSSGWQKPCWLGSDSSNSVHLSQRGWV